MSAGPAKSSPRPPKERAEPPKGSVTPPKGSPEHLAARGLAELAFGRASVQRTLFGVAEHVPGPLAQSVGEKRRLH